MSPWAASMSHLELLASHNGALRRDIEALGHLAATAEGVSEESLDCCLQFRLL